MPLPNQRPGIRPELVNRPGNGHSNNLDLNQRPNKGIFGISTHRSGFGNRPIQRPPIDRPGIGHRPGRPGSGNRPWWNSGHRHGIGHNPHHGINNNFRHSLNWSTHYGHWGYNPWWCRPACRPWYGGSWSYCWRPNYYYHYPYWPGYCSGSIIGWGLSTWSLGTLIYDTGYSSYYNPYPAQAVITSAGDYIDYSEPITQLSAQTAPADEGRIADITERSESYIEQSQEAFKQQNYLAALDYANKAVAEAPGDGALHEYRALVLFALAKYTEAAGVLHPVIASGPGWDWTTMIKLYDSKKTYTDQLRKLEQYSLAYPKTAEVHFLLGYHYMVCNYINRAKEQFETAAELQPTDTISQQLASLASVSDPKNNDPTTVDPAPSTAAPAPSGQSTPTPAPAADPVPPGKLAGTWVADKGAEGKITLTLGKDTSFTWTYAKPNEKTFELKGQYKINEKGLLVLDSGSSQMVANISMPEDKQMQFILAAGPPGDPGLTFEKF